VKLHCSARRSSGSRFRTAARFLLPVLLVCSGHLRSSAQLVVEAGPAREQIHVTSLRAQRDFGVVKQQFDYSCGAAALATLLTYGLNDKVDEETLLHALFDGLSTDQVGALQKNGFSLLELQRLAQNRGYKAQGFRIPQEQLSRLRSPVIVFIRPHDYRHFAVFKGVRGDRVYLADPSLGNVRMPLYRFLDMWADKSRHGILFAVEKTNGQWPERFALQLDGPAHAPVEILSAAKMSEVGALVLPLSTGSSR
jgi:predicted double-glycine peptidase